MSELAFAVGRTGPASALLQGFCKDADRFGRMDDITERFIAVLTHARQASPHTVRSYRTSLQQFARHLQRRNVAGIHAATYDDVEAFALAMGRAGLAPRTCRLRMAAVSTLFRYLVARGEVDRDPTKGVPRPKVPDDEADHLTGPELAAMFAAARTPRDRAIVQLLYCTLRADELRTARVDRLDMRAGTLRVRRKGNRLRTCAIDDAAIDALQAYLPLRRPIDSPWLLPGRDPTRPATYGVLLRTVERVAAAAGIERRVTPHMLRHGRGEAMRAAHVDPFMIQRAMDHQSLHITASYVHPPVADVRAALDTRAAPTSMDQLLQLLTAELLPRLQPMQVQPGH